MSLLFLVLYDSIAVDLDGLADGTIDLIYLMCEQGRPLTSVIPEDRITRNEVQILPESLFDQPIANNRTIIKGKTLHHVKAAVLNEDRIPDFLDRITAGNTTVDENTTDVTSERKRQTYDLSLDINLTWADVATMINEKFPHEHPFDAGSAQKAAERYREEHGKEPIPKRPRGRRRQS